MLNNIKNIAQLFAITLKKKKNSNLKNVEKTLPALIKHFKLKLNSIIKI